MPALIPDSTEQKTLAPIPGQSTEKYTTSSRYKYYTGPNLERIGSLTPPHETKTRAISSRTAANMVTSTKRRKE